MDIDATALKDVISQTLNNLRLLETELHAQRFAIHLATEAGLADPAIPWDGMIASAKENPELLRRMADKYDPLAQELLTSVDLAEMQAKVLELLRQWKPSGPVN